MRTCIRSYNVSNKSKIARFRSYPHACHHQYVAVRTRCRWAFYSLSGYLNESNNVALKAHVKLLWSYLPISSSTGDTLVNGQEAL